MRAYHLLTSVAVGTVGLSLAPPVAAQVILDRADPTITEQALPRPSLERPEPARPSDVEAASPAVAGTVTRTAPITAVTVAGADGGGWLGLGLGAIHRARFHGSRGRGAYPSL